MYFITKKRKIFYYKNIAKLVNENHKVMSKISQLVQEKEQQEIGRPRAIIGRERRTIFRIACNFKDAARQIAVEVGVTTNIRNIRCILQLER